VIFISIFFFIAIAVITIFCVITSVIVAVRGQAAIAFKHKQAAGEYLLFQDAVKQKIPSCLAHAAPMDILRSPLKKRFKVQVLAFLLSEVVMFSVPSINPNAVCRHHIVTIDSGAFSNTMALSIEAQQQQLK
jgi:hypothetical protein